MPIVWLLEYDVCQSCPHVEGGYSQRRCRKTGSSSFRSCYSLLKTLLLFFTRFQGQNKQLCLTKGICLPCFYECTTMRNILPVVTSVLPLLEILSICFSFASIAGTREINVPTLHLGSGHEEFQPGFDLPWLVLSL